VRAEPQVMYTNHHIQSKNEGDYVSWGPMIGRHINRGREKHQSNKPK